MIYLFIKAALSGLIVMAASEIARRSPTYGALLVSPPLVAILAMIWLWRETGDTERIASLSEGTFAGSLRSSAHQPRTAIGTKQTWP